MVNGQLSTIMQAMQSKIKASEEGGVLHLSQQLLDSWGVQEGDDVEIVVVDKTLIIRSISEAERAKRVQQATDKVFERYDRVFTALAEGAP